MSDYCVIGSQEKSWSVFNVQEGTQVCEIPTDRGVTAMGFQPDGLIMATGHFGGQIKLWDIRSV